MTTIQKKNIIEVKRKKFMFAASYLKLCEYDDFITYSTTCGFASKKKKILKPPEI